MSSEKDSNSINKSRFDGVFTNKTSSISTTDENNISTFTTTSSSNIYNKDTLIPPSTKQDTSFKKGKASNSSQQTNSVYSDKPNSTTSFSFENSGNKSFNASSLNQQQISFGNFDAILKQKVDNIEENLLTKQQLALGSLDKKLNDAVRDIDKHKADTNTELKETRNSVLGTIALFAAFFTFVSVNVNIFTKAENVTQSLIFMLSFWLCIVGFISLFFLFLNKHVDTKIHKTAEFFTTVACIVLSGILMYLLFKNSDQNSYQKLNEKLISIQNENKKLREENAELNKKISSKFVFIDDQIMELRKNQYQLNQSN
ncbi:hypothetical protein AB3504_08960 [Acinetobacter baumannii]|uniref:hypothetical protein n=1 Tax=Acinetobacter baumannii TaxID=470 RepID=UPI0018AFAF82|nr:hypothetical protein [Acinetobacter baumannii]MBF9226868.1 hypothetical protein [Acinetobacter baumannii]MCG6631489.1 hypothetical protein [Acinetobacter baumannii]MCZ3343243.1 hypothetical protein [Acinetobacter baumannii]MDN8152741.1 hypothetical protein [Acinetobacter baumannii]MDO7414716.1 hypothetical protein [Acinetobacter baumannii]